MTETITTRDIRQYQIEAGAAGDQLTCALCDLAIDGELIEGRFDLMRPDERETWAGEYASYSPDDACAEVQRIIAEVRS